MRHSLIVLLIVARSPIGGGEEFLFVLVVRAAARGVEGARRAVEVALEQEHRRDAERGAVRRRVALERAHEQRRAPASCRARPSQCARRRRG